MPSQTRTIRVWITNFTISMASWLAFVINRSNYSITARPRETRFLVPEKSSAAQNRTSWGLYLCTEVDFFSKNSVTSRLQCILRLLLCSVVYHVIQGHSISIYKDDCLMTAWWLHDDCMMTAWWLHDDYLVIGLVIGIVICRLCSHYLIMNRHFDYLGTDYIRYRLHESLFSN